MQDNQSMLHLYVLGPGVGESIVIRLPDGKWGVIDCFCNKGGSSQSSIDTFDFLQRKHVDALEFLCLTHPHHDHYSGMIQLLENLRIKNFWQFPEMCGDDLLYLLQTFRQTSKEHEATALGSLLGLADRMRKQKQLDIEYVRGVSQIYPTSVTIGGSSPVSEIAIWALAPSSGISADYRSKITACFDKDYRLLSKAPRHAYHNYISIALLMMYGDTHILLGGDTIIRSWKATLQKIDNKSILSVDFVKVGHHGSANANDLPLWELFSSKRKPIAVITPFVSSRLPRQNVLKLIRQHSSDLISTCPEVLEPRTRERYDLSGKNSQKKLATLKKLKCHSYITRSSLNTGICHVRFDNNGHGETEFLHIGNNFSETL